MLVEQLTTDTTDICYNFKCMNAPLVIILQNVRSAHNVGSIFRTADAVGAAVWTTGITPHPPTRHDSRPAHVADRALHLIAKTALGAESMVPHQHFAELAAAVAAARSSHYTISALEQAEDAIGLFEHKTTSPTALIVGPEVGGLTAPELALCDIILEIPMLGAKESLNVAVAAGIVLYALSRDRLTA